MGAEQASNYFGITLQHWGFDLRAIGYERHDCFVPYMALRDMGIQAGASVLDVGCGLGMGSYLFTDCEYYGIDASADMVLKCREVHDPKDRISSSHFRLATPDLIRGSYDWVIAQCIFSVGYKWEEVAPVIADCLKICRKGFGFTFLTTGLSGENGLLKSWPIDTRWLPLVFKLGVERWTLRNNFHPKMAALYLYRG